MRDLAAVLRAAVRSLAEARVRYVIVGGVGANLYGRPRSTFGVDLILDLSEDDAERLASAFRAHGFVVSPEDIRDALHERAHFTVHDLRSEYRLDCKGGYTARERVALDLRRRVRSGRGYLYVDAPEDLIVAKLLFGSAQDVLDAEAVYARQLPRLNLRRVTSLAKRFGVAAEWRGLRRRVDRILREAS
jgi:hypothetical protein